MSWLSYVNPVNWVKSIVTQKYVGSTVRNVVQFLAGVLTTMGGVELTAGEAGQFVDINSKVLTGLSMAGVTFLLSLANAKKNVDSK